MEQEFWNLSNEIGNSNGCSTSEGDILLGQLAAVLGSPSTGVSSSIDQSRNPSPIIVDVGNVLLQLSAAVSEAKSEAARERALRLAVETEHRQLLMSQVPAPHVAAPSLELSQTATTVDDHSVFSCSVPGESSCLDDIHDNLTMRDIMMYVSALPPHIQDCVYMVYGNLSEYLYTGLIDAARVQRIFRPSDYETDCFSSFELHFIMFSDMLYPVTIMNKFNNGQVVQVIKYSAENLRNRIAGFVNTASAAVVAEDSCEDLLPRMNLLEALNVQSDDDIRRIITVRKCHKLGFKSHVFLKQYFAKFGKVERVVLLPMRVKVQSSGPSRGNRPSSMGFVVFENESTVHNVLDFDNSSGIHIIKGWPIEVRNFVRPADRPDTPWVNKTDLNHTKSSTTTHSAFDITDSLW
jgi:hypothetical protein